jgi:hypothetical protein
MRPSKELRAMINAYEASSKIDAVYEADRRIEKVQLDKKSEVYSGTRR